MRTSQPVDPRQAEESRKFGRVVLFSVLAFFMTFICVNAFFAYKAVTTYTGVVVENAYEKGLHFNKIIAEAKKRQQETLHAPANSNPTSTNTDSATRPE